MEADYLIIGQGISGTLLSRALIRQGKSVIVVDDANPTTASRVASGIINPVTGMRLVKTWMIDELLPYAHDTYKEIERELGIAIISQCNILDFHLSPDAAQAFNEKQGDERGHLRIIEDDSTHVELFRYNYGIGEISPCLLVNINSLLTAWRKHLFQAGALLETLFNWDDCLIGESNIIYKNITAQKIIFCDGAACADNPYFDRLPWSKDKGEALIAQIPGLPAHNIYKQGINIVPWHDGLFWIGATHDWKFTNMQPTPGFRNRVEEQLNYWLKLPYTIVDHIVAARPVNVDRKPFIGFHPLQPTVGIFNGMGTKGCSLAPYFAHQFARHMAHDSPLLPDVDIKRFSRILSR